MHLDLNGANAHDLTWVVISHTYDISTLHRLVRTEPISVRAYMKRACRIKYLFITTSNTTSKNNQNISRIRIINSGDNRGLTITIGFIFQFIRTVSFLLILQLPTILNDMSIFLTIPAELIPASGLRTTFTVLALVSIIVVVVGFLLGLASNLQYFALGG